MAQVVIAREDGGSGDWLAGGDIGECAYFANAATLSELEAMIREAAELVGAESEIVILSGAVAETVTA